MSKEQATSDVEFLMKEPLSTDERPTGDQWKRLSQAVPNIDLNKAFHDKSGIPNHPLLKNRQEMAVKRALKEAVDN